jgi:hypothetical protein
MAKKSPATKAVEALKHKKGQAQEICFEQIMGTSEELRVFIRDQQELWWRTVRELGLPIE